MSQTPSPQPARSAVPSSGGSRSEPIRDLLSRAIKHDAVADEVIEIQQAHAGGHCTRAELAAAVRLKVQHVLRAATGEDWMAVTEAYIANGDRLDRTALLESGASRVHEFDGARIDVGLVRDFLAMVVTDPAAADRLAEVGQAALSQTTTRNAEAMRRAVAEIFAREVTEDDWNEIAGRLIADPLDMDAESRLSFYDLHRQSYAAGGPIAEAAEFTIGDFPSADGGVGPGGEFTVKLIELANGRRRALYPHLEAFGEGTDALRRGIAAGLLEALGPVASRGEFGRRLIALGFVDRSDSPLGQGEQAVTA